jgi:plasmid stabilization system protein ParE
MSSPYELSPRARLDLLEIWERIARDNLDTADRVIARIEATITLIASRPGIGHARPELLPTDLHAIR